MNINSYQASKLDEPFRPDWNLIFYNVQQLLVIPNDQPMAELERQAGTIAVTNAA